MPQANKPFLYLFMGLIASGKSTLTRLWAQNQDIACFNSDAVRKELAGRVAGTAADYGNGIYTPEFSRRTYDELLRLAAQEISQGRSVALDGSYQRLAERQHIVRYCAEHGVDFCFILCFCSHGETRRRLAVRAQDPEEISDGTWEIFLRQEQVFDYPSELDTKRFFPLETSHPPDQLLIELQKRVASCQGPA